MQLGHWAGDRSAACALHRDNSSVTSCRCCVCIAACLTSCPLLSIIAQSRQTVHKLMCPAEHLAIMLCCSSLLDYILCACLQSLVLQIEPSQQLLSCLGTWFPIVESCCTHLDLQLLHGMCHGVLHNFAQLLFMHQLEAQQFCWQALQCKNMGRPHLSRTSRC